MSIGTCKPLPHGVELLRNPRYNKGMSFSADERDKMHLRGLLPAATFTQEMQVWPGGWCSPRHLTHSTLSPRLLSQMAPCDVV
jgi:hypothetical protein